MSLGVNPVILSNFIVLSPNGPKREFVRFLISQLGAQNKCQNVICGWVDLYLD